VCPRHRSNGLRVDMRTLTQVVLSGGTAGAVLPDITPELGRAKIKLRRAQVAMFAAQPNGGKSLLALWYSVMRKIPTLYVSADTDPHSTMWRAAAMLSGRDMDQVETLMEQDPQWVADTLQGAKHVRFAFDPSPTLSDVDLELQAYKEVMGEPPVLLVVDNLMNVIGGDGANEWTGMREVMSAMHHFARTTGACVLILHHVSESGQTKTEQDPKLPAARRMIQGKVSQLPELIVTIGLDPLEGLMRVACVKNRHGFHDATAQTFHTLAVDLPRMTVFENVQQKQLRDKMSEWA